MSGRYPVVTESLAPLDSPVVLQRRAQERRPLRAQAQLRLTEARVITVHTFDISSGGLGLVSPTNLQVGSNCIVSLPLPDSQHTKAVAKMLAEVSHCIFTSAEGAFKVGLRFIEVPPDSAALISRYLSV